MELVLFVCRWPTFESLKLIGHPVSVIAGRLPRQDVMQAPANEKT
jgi:hypothetical protein